VVRQLDGVFSLCCLWHRLPYGFVQDVVVRNSQLQTANEEECISIVTTRAIP
jgi:hypothetical protein